MTIYRLPDGTEVTEYNCTLPKSPQHVWVQHPTLGAITVDSALLTEVVPEPPHGYVGRSGDTVWQRDDNPEQLGLVAEAGYHWWKVGEATAYTWAGVCEDLDGPLVELVPDPAAGAPALPWHIGSCGREASVYAPRPTDEHGSIMVHVHVQKDDYTLDEVRQMAVALWGAARDHEEASR